MVLAGAVLSGRYELAEPIGTGGYSEVWRATDTVLSRPVAVKLLHSRHVQRAEALRRFLAEARYAGGLWLSDPERWALTGPRSWDRGPSHRAVTCAKA